MDDRTAAHSYSSVRTKHTYSSTTIIIIVVLIAVCPTLLTDRSESQLKGDQYTYVPRVAFYSSTAEYAVVPVQATLLL